MGWVSISRVSSSSILNLICLNLAMYNLKYNPWLGKRDRYFLYRVLSSQCIDISDRIGYLKIDTTRNTRDIRIFNEQFNKRLMSKQHWAVHRSPLTSYWAVSGERFAKPLSKLVSGLPNRSLDSSLDWAVSCELFGNSSVSYWAVQANVRKREKTWENV